MASGEQRPSRCLSIRRDHTPREIQSIVFLLLWTMWAIYLHGLCSFFWKIAYIDLTWVKTMCVIYLSTWTQFFLFLFFFLKIISHWSLFHLIFLYLCLESHHPIHLVRPYGRLTLYLKLLKRLLRFYVLKSWVDLGVGTLSQLLTLNPP